MNKIINKLFINLPFFLAWGVVWLIFPSGSVSAQSPVPDDASAKLVAKGFSLSEGPYWHPDGYLLFSDVSANIIYKWSEEQGIQTYFTPSGEANGIAADPDGNILLAQHSARQVGKIQSDLGGVTPLATNYQGNRLHSPNDLVVKSDGAIFFTDPPWGGNPSELDFHGVYRIPPGGGETQLLVDSLSYPNGIAFSPDESKLYIAETNNSYIHVYDVVGDTALANGRLFVIANQYGNPDQNGADGMKTDNNGNLWIAASEGVAIFSPEGELLNIISIPGSTTNVGFGGTDSLSLFVTNFTGLYKINLGPLKKLEPPVNLQTTPTGEGVVLTWEISATSLKYVTVYKRTNDGEFKKVLVTAYTDSFTDREIGAPGSYTYKVTVTDVMGFESDFSEEIDLVYTDMEEDESNYGYSLQQNYPNPFNPTTTIKYQLSEASEVVLEVFDINGRLVSRLVETRQTAGIHEVKFNAEDLSSGMYLYRLKTGNRVLNRKLMLIK